MYETDTNTLPSASGGPIPTEAPEPEARASAAAAPEDGASDGDLDAKGRRALFLDGQGRWREGTAVLSPATSDISASLRRLGYCRDAFVEGYRDDDPALELWSAESPPA